jgi:PKD repeat protein
MAVKQPQSRWPGLQCAFGSTLLLMLLFSTAGASASDITATPSSGAAPLTVDFTTSLSGSTYHWDFGDGAVSTAANTSHLYPVAGTFNVVFTATDSLGAETKALTTITVIGSDTAPVTDNMSFRWAIRDANFKLNFNQANTDTLTIKSVFSTADLPTNITGQALSFGINGTTIYSGIFNTQGFIESPENAKPSVFIEMILSEQALFIYVTKGSLAAALASSGATNSTVLAPGANVPVTFTLTIGIRTYSLTENFNYRAQSGKTGRGKFNIQKNTGSVNQGAFLITRGSAKETFSGDSHYLEFDGVLAMPNNAILQQPKTGVFQFRFSESNVETIVFDRIFKKGTTLTFEQTDRDLAGVRRFTIDTKKRTFTLGTWDIKRDRNFGGSGIPLHDTPVTEYFFEMRIDFDQPDGTTFRGVAATLLTRRSDSDTTWTSGHKNKK